MSYSDEILNQLKKTPSFKPICAETFGDWSIEAGDILTIDSEGQIHTLPVFSSEMDWKGSARTTLTASGNSKREVQKRREREEYGYQQSVRRSIGGLGGQIEGIREDYVELVARVEDAEAGIAARVLIDDLNGYKEAVANTYATIEGMTAGLSTKVENSKLGDYLTKKAASELYVTDGDVDAIIGAYVVSDGTSSKTFAQILADVTSISGRLEVGDTTTVHGGLYASGGIGAAGTMLASGGLHIVGNFRWDNSDIKKETVPIVTSFTQASGETSTPVDCPLLYILAGEETIHKPNAGETVNW